MLVRVIDRMPEAGELANAILCYGLLRAGHLDRRLHSEPRLTHLLRDGRPVVAYVAASSLARIKAATGDVDRSGVDLLLRVMGERPGALSSTALRWNDGDLVGLGWITLEVAAPEFDLALVERASRLLRTLQGPRAETLAGVLLSKLFPKGSASAPQDADLLTAEQRAFLEALAAEPNVWKMGGAVFANFSLMVTDFGLPGDASAVGRYLSGEPLESCRPPGLRPGIQMKHP